MPTQEPLIPGFEPKDITDQTHPEELRAFQHWLETSSIPWAGLFAQLMTQGFTWREAAVTAWMVPFKAERTPPTQKELAAFLGCGADTVSHHVNKPKCQMAALTHRRLAFLPHIDDVLRAHLDTVLKPGGRQTSERIRFLEEMGIYKARTGDGVTVNVGQKVDINQDLSQLSNEELAQMASALEVEDDDAA